MTVEISKSRFKARALEYFREVERTGQPITITDHGRPTLEIRALEKKTGARDALERLRGSVKSYERPFEPVDEADWDAVD